jgi:hypothetical protein
MLVALEFAASSAASVGGPPGRALEPARKRFSARQSRRDVVRNPGEPRFLTVCIGCNMCRPQGS